MKIITPFVDLRSKKKLFFLKLMEDIPQYAFSFFSSRCCFFLCCYVSVFFCVFVRAPLYAYILLCAAVVYIYLCLFFSLSLFSPLDFIFLIICLKIQQRCCERSTMYAPKTETLHHTASRVWRALGTIWNWMEYGSCLTVFGIFHVLTNWHRLLQAII